MAKFFKRTSLAALVLLVAYVLTVQVLRWIAFGDEEREALALMEQPVPAPEGPGGFKYLAFPNLVVPQDELDAALAEDVAAYREWHAGAGERFALESTGDENTQSFVSPVAARYPERAELEFPEGACGFRDADCLEVLRGHEPRFRDWLAGESDRLALARAAMRAEHLANPHPSGIDTPFPAYTLLRLAFHDIALQALDGDHAGALEQACELLGSARRFLRHDGLLIDKMVHASQAQAAAGLVLSIRRADPDLPMPASCAEALAPVAAGDYLLCNALRAEFEMSASLSRQMDAALAASWNPLRVGSRWLLIDGRLQRGWSAQPLSPLCREENLEAISQGRLPDPRPLEFSKASVDFWSAPVSNILANIGPPSYDNYQRRLLDHAAVLRLQLAAIAHANGEIESAEVVLAGASPGYAPVRDGDGWVLPLLAGERSAAPEFRIRAVAVPAAGEPGQQ
jgi:hypothetical protein